MNFDKLNELQKRIAAEALIEDRFPAELRTIAGFDIAFVGRTAVCAAVVCDAHTLEPLERKTLITEAPLPYIPGYLAFREGPPIVQLYHDLEHNPDLILIDGHGLAHPLRAGLATHVGVQLDRPCVGVAKHPLAGEIVEGALVIDGERRGVQVQTRPYAKPVIVSPGHRVSIDTAAALVKGTIRPPHKLPEPIHLAHRLAKKTLDRIQHDAPAKETADATAIEEEYFRANNAEFGAARF